MKIYGIQIQTVEKISGGYIMNLMPNRYTRALKYLRREDRLRCLGAGLLLHRVLGRDTMRIASFHDLDLPSAQKLVTINGWSANGDGVVEGAEYGDKILGVQGHPEVDDLLPELFAFLAQD